MNKTVVSFNQKLSEHFKMFSAAFEFQLNNQKQELEKTVLQINSKFNEQDVKISSLAEKLEFSEAKLTTQMKIKQTE